MRATSMHTAWTRSLICGTAAFRVWGLISNWGGGVVQGARPRILRQCGPSLHLGTLPSSPPGQRCSLRVCRGPPAQGGPSLPPEAPRLGPFLSALASFPNLFSVHPHPPDSPQMHASPSDIHFKSSAGSFLQDLICRSGISSSGPSMFALIQMASRCKHPSPPPPPWPALAPPQPGEMDPDPQLPPTFPHPQLHVAGLRSGRHHRLLLPPKPGLLALRLTASLLGLCATQQVIAL